MRKTCPFGYSNTQVDCHDKCVMYEDGCLFKKAVKLYIQNHTPFTMRKPTDEELTNWQEEAQYYLEKYKDAVLHPMASDKQLIPHDYIAP